MVHSNHPLRHLCCTKLSCFFARHCWFPNPVLYLGTESIIRVNLLLGTKSQLSSYRKCPCPLVLSSLSFGEVYRLKGTAFLNGSSLIRCLVNRVKRPISLLPLGLALQGHPSFRALMKSFEFLVETALHLTSPSVHFCFLPYPPIGFDPKSTP